MVEIGIVGLDTSHAEAYATSIRNHPTATLEAVWDGGDVRSDSYAEGFCDRNDAIQYSDPLEMADTVDAVMILTVDWNSHRDLAVPFLRRDVPTLIDKPIAGTLADVTAIRSAVETTPFFGGSAVPYHPSLRSFQANGDERTLYCVGYNDPFYYGCHVIDALSYLVNSHWASVMPADDPGKTVDIVFTDGTYATARLDDPSGYEQFTFFSVGDQTTVRDVGNSERDMAEMYYGYLDAFVEVVTGERESQSDRILDAATLLLAVNAALEEGQPITPECRNLAAYRANGRAFLEEYQPYY
ncbi:Gfo/Idh/MocA family oxidoreductase [Natronosalvus vescus]|uniref:Gfo/Idh/MocA family oxidoreductase n=1 Tax=Natronosalvus vescus TaxID=2953881 RepID=UPI002091DA0E|nr:Gfo/Idh/MocA family oxidoreductase [Natronosalvus vescus]